MKTTGHENHRLLFSTLALLSVAWLAAPLARQDGANDGFIVFTSDLANPSDAGICGNCEDIYVMSPDGTNPTRLTHGGGAPTDAGAYNSGGADWSHSKKLVAFHSNRVNRVPQIHLMNADGSEQQVLVSLRGGAAFPSFSRTGNELCFHSQASPRDIYIVNVHGTGLTNLTEPYRKPGPLGEPPPLTGDSIRCDWSAKGNAIAFTNGANAGQDIYVIDADGTGLRRLTCHRDYFRTRLDLPLAKMPGWPSLDGHRIAFESNRTGPIRNVRDERGRLEADAVDELRRGAEREQCAGYQAHLVYHRSPDRVPSRRWTRRGARPHPGLHRERG